MNQERKDPFIAGAEETFDQVKNLRRDKDPNSSHEAPVLMSRRAVQSAADAQEIQTEFVKDFNPKFMAGAEQYGYAPFNDHSAGFHLDHLNQEVLDTVAYLYAMRKAFAAAVGTLVAARGELDKENYQNVRTLLAKLHEQLNGS